jgi:ABC-type multidrug transport system fused ATPase/permease subunit
LLVLFLLTSYHHTCRLGEVLQGLPTIKAFGKCQEFIDRFYQLTDNQSSKFFYFWMASRWLAIRTDFVGVCIIFGVAMLAIGLADAGKLFPDNRLPVRP